MITAVVVQQDQQDLELLVACVVLKLAAAQAYAEQNALGVEVRLLRACKTLLALMMGGYGQPLEVQTAVYNSLSYNADGLLDAVKLMAEILTAIELHVDMMPTEVLQ